MAQFWQMLLMELKAQVCLSSTHHPEADGDMERVNAILEQYLQCFNNQQQDNWVKVLALSEFAYNNSQHASTRVSPFFGNHRFFPRLFPLAPSDSLVPAMDTFLQEVQAMYQVVKSQLGRAKSEKEEEEMEQGLAQGDGAVSVAQEE